MTRNKRADARSRWLEEIVELKPLDYLLTVMNRTDVPSKRRTAMARAALPYCHKKLKPVASTPEQLKAASEFLSSLYGYPVSVRNAPVRKKRSR